MWVVLVYAFFLNNIAELLSISALLSLSSSMDATKMNRFPCVLFVLFEGLPDSLCTDVILKSLRYAHW